MSGKDIKSSTKLSCPPWVQEKRRRYCWTTELDELLERGYRTGPASRFAPIDCIQRLTGWPRHACWDRARKLGFTHGRCLQRRWTSSDDHLLIALAGTCNLRFIAEKLNRSVAAVRTRLRRLGVSSIRVREGLTKTELAKMIGRTPTTAQKWIDLGWLKGSYEGKERRDDTFRVSESELLRFFRAHPEELPFHRWSREGLEWFLSLLADQT